MGNNREDIQNRDRRPRTKEEMIKRRKAIEARKKKRRRKRIITSIILIPIVLIMAILLYGYNFISGLKTNNLGNGNPPASSKDPINILVLGMDIGDAENQENKAGRRTDTIMVFNYNPNTKKAHLVSIPRDTLIEVDAYLDNGEYRRYWKINVAYVLDGEEEVTKHVESLLGIDINYLVEIDYNAFRSIIDSIGGVEMTIEKDMYYDDYEQDLHINFKAGETVLLDGEKAEEFIRWRKNNDGTGLENADLDRIRNQQLFISKVLDKVMTPSIIFKAEDILNAISENVETNIPAKNLVSLGMKMLRLKPSDIIMTTLKGEEQYFYGESFLVANKEDNIDLIKALNTDNPSTSNSLTTLKREDCKLLVLNGTNISGLASSARDTLYSLGYTNIEVGNSDIPKSKSVIQSGNDDLKALLKDDLDIEKFEKISKSEYEDYDAVIILGEDYNLFNNR